MAKLTNSKRLKFAIITFIIYLAIGITTLLFRPDSLTDMGVYLSITSIPLVTYILGETLRASNKKQL
jgi:Kef-type K+ transport system membrane component KefB